MNISGKIWGSTSKIFGANNVSVHRIVGSRGGKSSLHRHKSKHSLLFVERGSFAIHVTKNDYNLTDVTVLTPGHSTVILPGEYHLFEVLEDDSVCYEIYWVELDDDDIERKDVGSIVRQ